MNKSCTFNEWLLNKDEELYQEMKLGNAFRGAVAGGLIGLSTLGGNPESPVDKIRNQNDAFVKQHDAFMKDHNRKTAKMDKHIDALSAKKNAEEDEEYLRKNLTGDVSLDKYVRNALARKQQLRSIEGTPSQQVDDKAFMINHEMEADANNPRSFGHEDAKSGNYEKWKKSKEVDDFIMRTKADDLIGKLLSK